MPRLAMVCTRPQTAVIGAPYDADGRVVGGMDASDQDRARVDGHGRGGIHIRAERDGRLLRGEMLGLGVEHLAHLLAHAVEAGVTAQAMRARPIHHPTIAEGLATALSGIVQTLSPPHDASRAS